MKKPAAILATVLTVLTAACEPPPEFVASLSDPGSDAYEEWVLGHWYQPIDGGLMIKDGVAHAVIANYQVVTSEYIGETLHVEIRPEYDGKLLQITLVYQTSDGGGARHLTFVAFPSRVDGALYYNLVRAMTPGLIGFPKEGSTVEPHYYRVRTPAPNAVDYTAPGEEPGHMIVRLFRPTPDTMLVCGLFFRGVSKSGLSDDLTDALKDAGLAPRSARVPVRIHDIPIDLEDPDATARHTLVDGNREALLHLIRADPGSYFHPMFRFTRLGKLWSDPEEDPELRARILRHKNECRLEE